MADTARCPVANLCPRALGVCGRKFRNGDLDSFGAECVQADRAVCDARTKSPSRPRFGSCVPQGPSWGPRGISQSVDLRWACFGYFRVECDGRTDKVAIRAAGLTHFQGLVGEHTSSSQWYCVGRFRTGAQAPLISGPSIRNLGASAAGDQPVNTIHF